MTGCVPCFDLPVFSRGIGDSVWDGFTLGPSTTAPVPADLARLRVTFTLRSHTVTADSALPSDLEVLIVVPSTWHATVGIGALDPFPATGRWKFSIEAWEDGAVGSYVIANGTLLVS